jgi:hypothetical protein
MVIDERVAKPIDLGSGCLGRRTLVLCFDVSIERERDGGESRSLALSPKKKKRRAAAAASRHSSRGGEQTIHDDLIGSKKQKKKRPRAPRDLARTFL